MQTGSKRGAGRPPKGPDYQHKVRTTVFLSPDLIERLDRQAEKEGIDSRSEIIRRACEQYLGERGTRIKGRALKGVE